MRKMMFRLALAASAVVSYIAPLYAAPVPATIGTWVDLVNRQIDDVAAMPRDEVAGVATVSFRRGSDGTAIDIVPHAARPDLAAAALATALRLRHLPALPEGVSADQRITMRLLFGSSGDPLGYERRRAVLIATAARDNEAFAARRSDDRLALAQPR